MDPAASRGPKKDYKLGCFCKAPSWMMPNKNIVQFTEEQADTDGTPEPDMKKLNLVETSWN